MKTSIENGGAPLRQDESNDVLHEMGERSLIKSHGQRVRFRKVYGSPQREKRLTGAPHIRNNFSYIRYT